MSSLSRIWRIHQLSTEIRLHQALVMYVLLCCRNLIGHYFRVTKKRWRLSILQVPTPNPAHTLVSACHINAEISARTGLPRVMDFIRRRRLSVLGHIARLTQGTALCSTQRPTLPSWPSIRSFTWQGLETSLARWTDQLCNDTGSIPANSGDRPFYGAMVERRDGPSWLRDRRDDDERCLLNRNTGHCAASLHQWGYSDNPLCICVDRTQSMSHIINDCPVNKFEGGLHTASDSIREWLRPVHCIR